jgi:hypothetical protein
MRFTAVLSLFVISAIFAANPAAAQAYGTGGPGINFGSYHMYNLNMSIIGDSIKDNQAKNSGARATINSPESADILSTIYTPSAPRTRTNLHNFVKRTRPHDPAGAAQMEQLFASVDIIGEFGKVMGRVGLNKNNAADAFAVYWINAWSAARGESSAPSAEMAQAVAAQASLGLLQSPEFVNATEAQKQEMAEALMIQAALIDAAIELAASDNAQLQAVADAVKQGAAASGLDLDAMTLTEEGFISA